MFNQVISRMLQSLIKLGFIGFVFLLWSCGVRQAPPKSSKANLCKHSKYLVIHKISNGFQVEVLDPDAKEQPQIFKITKAYEHIAVLSATHVGMLCALKQQKRISAISDAKYLYDRQTKRLVATHKVLDLRAEMGFSPQKLLQNGTQVVVYSGFGNENKALKRLEGTKLLGIPNYEWREKTPLARAEWVLLFGVLSGEFDKAQAFFNGVEQKYTALQKSIQQNNKSNQLPVLISGNLYGDQWIAPAGQSYEAQLYKDAGLAYLFDNEQGTGSIFKSLPEILKKGTSVNLWLNPGQPSRAKLLAQFQKTKFLPFFEKAIYCYTSRTNKYWELAAVHPDWLLSDLSQIANRQVKKLHFYAVLK
jgi:iron complex transport system substrate-binding protein